MLRNAYEGKNRVVVSVKPPATDDDLPVLYFEGVDTPAEPEGEAVGAGETSDAT